MNTQKFMGSQSLNLANTAMKSLISLQNEIDGDFTPSGVLTASGGLVNPTGSVITATTTLEDADSGKTFAITAGSLSANATINIPTTPGFNARFVVTSVSETYTFRITTENANKIFGTRTQLSTNSSLGTGVNNVIYAVNNDGAGQQIGDVINVHVINSTRTLVTAVSIGTSSITMT